MHEVKNKQSFIERIHFDRLTILMAVLVLMTVLIIGKLFLLQVVDYPFYAALASDQHEMQEILRADRGEILMSDHSQPGELFLAATNKQFFKIYAVPKEIENPEEVAEKLVELVEMSAEDLISALSKEDDPYEPIERKVEEDRYLEISALELPGIYGIEETYRYYVNDNLGSHIIGFVGQKDDEIAGMYGLEGYFQDILAGQEGFFESERDVAGRWIVLSEKKVQEAVDGADIVLTIDRALQYRVCKRLNEAVIEHDAQGGTIIVMEPSTGRIMAICSNPDFNPNYYSEVEDSSVYNNKAIFEAYEPGSVFKPIIMSAAIDLDYVQPDSTFVDPGEVLIDTHTIRNADNKVYGEVTMTGVLENSINTGMMHVTKLMGRERFKDYVERFGFGEMAGIELQTEVGGNISSLSIPADIYSATASFGQGITVTPLQILSAYAAIANGGNLMKPYIVEEIRYASGGVERRQPEVIRQVISSKTAVLMTGMLTSVVESGHAGNAGVDGYYVAGKTGTAQIAGSQGEYLSNQTNHSFIGYAPADNPRFVAIVKLDRPTSAPYSASTSANVFHDIAEFVLTYYEVPPDYE